MKLEPIVKCVAQAVALSLLVVSHPLAQKSGEAPVAAPRKAEARPVASKDRAAAPRSAAAAARKAKNADAPKAGNGESVAVLKSIEGNVLVSQESGLASGDEAARLTEGSRVITTADSRAIVQYDDGCEVVLKPNQRLEIDTDKPCKERIVQAESIFLEPAGMALAAGSAGVGGGAAAAVLSGSLGATAGLAAASVAGLTGLAALANARQESVVSPN